MPFENNGTLQKWDVTNTPPEIDKYGIHKIMAAYINSITKYSTKNHAPCKTMPKDYLLWAA